MQGQTPRYLISTLVTPPATFGLTTLTNLKLELGINATDTSNDTWLTLAIARVSADVARYCNRVWGKATWQDEFQLARGIWGEGIRAANNPLFLAHYPLVSITSVVETVLGVATALVSGTDFEVEIPSALSGDEGSGRIFRLDGDSSTLQPRSWPAAKVVIQYVAGYALPNDSSPNLPSDVEGAVLRLLTLRYRAKGRDPTMVQENIVNEADRRWWVGAQPGSRGGMPAEIADLFDASYRVPVTA